MENGMILKKSNRFFNRISQHKNWKSQRCSITKI